MLSVSGVADAIHIATYYIGNILIEANERMPSYNNSSYRPSSVARRSGYQGSSYVPGYSSSTPYQSGAAAHGHAAAAPPQQQQQPRREERRPRREDRAPAEARAEEPAVEEAAAEAEAVADRNPFEPAENPFVRDNRARAGLRPRREDRREERGERHRRPERSLLL